MGTSTQLRPDMESTMRLQRRGRLGEKERQKIAGLLFPKEQQRQEVGEQVYPLVEKMGAGSEAGLVTGILLTLDISIVEEAVEEPEVLSRLVSSALSRIEECRRSKAKEKENATGSDCGSSESDDSYSEVVKQSEKEEGGSDSCGSSDAGSSLL